MFLSRGCYVVAVVVVVVVVVGGGVVVTVVIVSGGGGGCLNLFFLFVGVVVGVGVVIVG